VIKVFIDANIYFAGVVSKQGASALILELARRKKVQIFSSRLVLREADRNLRKKSDAATLKAFRRFIQNIKITVLPPLREELLAPYESMIHPKDVPVLAAASESKAEFLITLDRRHFLTPTLLSKLKKIKIMLPGEFLREIYLKGKDITNKNS